MGEEWRETVIGEVTTFASGFSFPERYQGKRAGRWPFLKVSDMNAPGNGRALASAANWVDEEDIRGLRAKTWPAGTVVFPKVGAALLTEKRRILAVEASFDNNVMGLVPGPLLLPEYLLAFMETIRLGDLAQMGALPSINQSHVANVRLPLPPLAVQRRIVDLRLTLDDASASALSVATAAQRVVSALGHQLMLEAEAPLLRLGDIAEIQQGRTLAKSEMSGGNSPVFGANGVIGWHSSGHYNHEVIALGCRGSCGTVHMAPAGAWLANNVMALWPKSSKALDIRFLRFALERADLISTGVISGQVQPQITRASLTPLMVAIPAIDEQRRIEALVEAAEEVVGGAQETCSRINRLSVALLSGLVSNEQELPISYDRFLDVA